MQKKLLPLLCLVMPDNLFPYFHILHASRQLKVSACQTGWCPTIFLSKLFSIIEIQHAHEQDVLGILLDKPWEVPCTIGEEVEEHTVLVVPCKRRRPQWL